VIFPRTITPSLFDAVLAFYHRHGATPAIAQEAIQMQTIVNLVSAGIGIAWVPRSVMQLQRPGVVYRRLGAVGGRAARADQPGLAAGRCRTGRVAICRVRANGCRPALSYRCARFAAPFVHGPHAPAIRPGRPADRPHRDPLVRADLPGRIRSVRVAGLAACEAAAVRERRLDPPRRRGLALLRRAGRRDRRPARLRAVLQARLLREPSVRDLRGVEGRNGLSRRAARRDRRDGAVRTWQGAAVPAGGRPGRAVRALPGSRRGESATFINGELWGRAADPACRGR
jgi:hypothetical protein